MSSYYKSEGGAFRDFVSARAFSVFRREEASRLTIPRSHRSRHEAPAAQVLQLRHSRGFVRASGVCASRGRTVRGQGHRSLTSTVGVTLIIIPSKVPFFIALGLLLTKIVLLVTLTCVVLSRMPRDYDTPSCPRRNRASDGRDKHRRLPGTLRAPENLR